MANQPVDLLAIAKSMDPGFGENMPKEVADAFANGDVARVFRTHGQLGRAKEALKHDLFSGKTLGEGGEWHGGSIYVQTKDGRTARFKGSASSVNEYDPVNQPGVTDAGWNSTKGRGAFAYDKTGLYDPESKVYRDSVASINPKGDSAEGTYAAARASSRDIAPMTGDQMLGLRTFEYNDDMSLRHTGSPVTEVFESSGQRHFYGSTEATDIYGRKSLERGDKSSEPVSDYMARKGIQTPAMEVKDKGEALAREVSSNAGGEGIGIAQKTSEDQQDDAKDSLVEQAQEKGAETLQEKAKEKLEGKLEEKAKEKTKEAVKEINDVGGAEKTAERTAKKSTESTMKVGKPAPHVPTAPTAATSTATATATATQQAAHTAANHPGTAGNIAQQAANAAGHGMPPAGAATATKVTRSINSMDDLMKAGKGLADEVWKGVKGSKNARVAGLAVLAAGAGWAAEKMKSHQKTADAEYNRQQQIRRQLMSDG